MKYAILGSFLLITPTLCFAGNVMPIVGAYYDNILKGSGELGVIYSYERVERDFVKRDGTKEKVFDHLNFVYAEGESNGDDKSITLGLGKHFGEGSIRGGISKINKNNDSLLGVEGVFTAFFFSFKAGLYQNHDTHSTEGMLGIGFSVVGGF